ncbi:hypothetical protein SLS59_008156 [Nothophoma quercina]|uniref:BTB domain-containing protein n=1 Tax=Nothophoma quercina TaxID=749835 RepID=A0ABR3QTN6_9PLEO
MSHDRLSSEDVSIEQELDVEAVQVYIDWLYSGALRIDDSLDRNDDDFNFALLQCWEVANALQDRTFRDAVICTFFTEVKARFWSKSIKLAFEDNKGSDEMRQFVMRVFMTQMGQGSFRKWAHKWPKVFVIALADMSVEKALNGGCKSAVYLEDVDDLKAEYLGRSESKDEHKKADKLVYITPEDDSVVYYVPADEEADRRTVVWKKRSTVPVSDDDKDSSEELDQPIRSSKQARVQRVSGIRKPGRASYDAKTITGVDRRKTTYSRKSHTTYGPHDRRFGLR